MAYDRDNAIAGRAASRDDTVGYDAGVAEGSARRATAEAGGAVGGAGRVEVAAVDSVGAAGAGAGKAAGAAASRDAGERTCERFFKVHDITDDETSQRNHLERGCVQVYTGDGKGKTTAAFGLALRAMGYGLDVRIVQFGKDKRCSEHVEAERMGLPVYLCKQGRGSISAARQFELAGRFVDEGEVDVLILDEIMHAVNHGWVALSDLLGLIARKPGRMELVLTGRRVPSEVFDVADLVTEMRPLKHYVDGGVIARRGIEF